MSARLTDEQIAAWVTDRYYNAAENANVPTLAAVLAAEVQEYRTRRCDGCVHASDMRTGDDHVLCVGIDRFVPAHHACNAWTPRPSC